MKLINKRYTQQEQKKSSIKYKRDQIRQCERDEGNSKDNWMEKESETLSHRGLENQNGSKDKIIMS